MARDDHQLKFRVPEGLKARIERYAKEEGRSLNAEILATLERAYPPMIPIEDVFNSVVRHFGNSKAPRDIAVLASTLKNLEETIQEQLSGERFTEDSHDHLRIMLDRVRARIAAMPVSSSDIDQ